MSTLTITEFLEARITEDEAVARGAIDPERPGTHWQWVTTETDTVVAPGDEVEAISHQDISLRSVEVFPTQSVGELPAFIINRVEEMQEGAGAHIARHDPARVLAECAAKRAIITSYASCKGAEAATDITKEFGVKLTVSGMVKGLELAVKHLAAVYADHADYLPEWAL